MSSAQAVTKPNPRRLSALALIAALALAPVVVGSEQAVASTPDPCRPFASADNSATAPTPQTEIPDGNGTLAAPYLITSKKELVWVSWVTSISNTDVTVRDAARAAFYKQTADIDLAEGGACNWLPIGDDPSSPQEFGGRGPDFTGVYDGGGKSISNLVFTDYGSNREEIGLFGRVTGASLSNINLKNISVTAASESVGGLVGLARATEISNSSVVGGEVSGSSDVGGLVGTLVASQADRSQLTQSLSTTSVSGSGDSVGGLVGRAESSTIQLSYASGSVTGRDAVGGLVGLAQGGYFNDTPPPPLEVRITDSYALGAVDGRNRVGGLVGRLNGAPQQDLDQQVVEGPATVVRSFSSGEVTGSGSNVGGFVGDAGASDGVFRGEFEASFWDTTMTAPLRGVGSRVEDSVIGLVGKLTSEMKIIDTFDAAGWSIVADFEPSNAPTKVWGICSGQHYPYLLWQFDADPCVVGGSAGTTSSANLAPALHMNLKAKTGDVVAGSSVLMEGQGLKPGSAYSLVVRSTPVTVKSGVVSGGGTFSHTVGLPAGIAPGVHTITLTGTGPGGENLVLTQSFTVASNGTFSAIGSVTGQVSGGLAATGVDGPLALGATSLAALLVLVGAGLMVARRRAEALSS
jgi:hypothetical protein